AAVGLLVEGVIAAATTNAIVTMSVPRRRAGRMGRPCYPALGLSPRVPIEDEWGDRLLREVELVAQIAEDRDVFSDRRPGVGPALVLPVEPLTAEESILDELQIGVRRKRLVNDVPPVA